VPALLLAAAACAPGVAPPPDDARCADLFSGLDAIEKGPNAAMAGFDFRAQQIARIQEARCVTFSRQIAELEALAGELAPHSPPPGPALVPTAAVQAGVVTRDADAARARAFFEGLGYRARTQGSPRLGTRVYVEAGTLGQVEDIVATARRAGFVGAYPSRFVRF